MTKLLNLTTEDCIFLAKGNLASAESLLKAVCSFSLNNFACYHCQQAAEMAAKAVFTEKFPDLDFEKTHDIVRLLNQLPDELKGEQAENLYLTASQLTIYAAKTRYEETRNIDIQYTDKRTEDAIDKAAKFIAWAEKTIQEIRDGKK